MFSIPRNRKTLLYVLAIGSPIAFSVWQALLNNFAVEIANFGGKEIGMLQSLREVPGFLAFTVVFLLLIIRQQNFAIVSLILLGIGTALTGFFPSILGLYITTVTMSIGFNYLETLRSSLSLQWLSKEEAPVLLGKLLSVHSASTLVILSILYITVLFFEPSKQSLYALAA